MNSKQMTAAITRAVLQSGAAAPAIRRFPWWLMALASPFVETLRKLREMRYLWQTPLRMRNSKLLAVLGKEPHTPLDTAVEATLRGMGCMG